MKKIITIFLGCLLLASCSGMLDIESTPPYRREV